MSGRKGSGSSRDEQMRRRLSIEAAKLMAQERITDFAIAKRKAAERLGVQGSRNLPSNQEIEKELLAYQQLFHSDTQPHHLRELRESAIHAMRMLAPFTPRLVGAVLTGSADQHTPVTLHLFAETPESVGIFLMEKQIPFEHDDRLVRLNADTQQRFPLFRFVAGEVVHELIVFPLQGLRHSPLSPVDGRPMKRADVDAVVTLLDESTTKS